MKTKRGAQWYVKRIFGTIGLLWFFQLFAILGIVFVDLATHGWNDDRKAPAWIEMWGIFGVFIPTILIVVAMLGYMTYAFIEWFREDS